MKALKTNKCHSDWSKDQYPGTTEKKPLKAIFQILPISKIRESDVLILEQPG